MLFVFEYLFGAISILKNPGGLLPAPAASFILHGWH